MQIVDEGLQTKTTTVSVRVLRADNVAPSAAPGGPYIIEAGQDLVLNGASSDGNLACGDSVTTNWDLTGNGQFNDAEGERPTVSWNTIQNLPRGEANRIFVRAVDGLVLSPMSPRQR